MLRTRCVVAALIVQLGFSASAAAARYVVTDLGSFGGPYIEARGINSSGHIVGYATTPEPGIRLAFDWNNAAMLDLGNLGGLFSIAERINNHGHIVGSSLSNSNRHAFLYDTSLHDLGTLGGSWSMANDINDQGQIAGSSAYVLGVRAFLYDRNMEPDVGTDMRNLGSLGGSDSAAHGINQKGEVVGYSDVLGDVAQHAFYYYDGTMHDIGTLGGKNSSASDINDSGIIVGYSNIDGTTAKHAFLYDGTSMRDLGTLGGSYSTALAINSKGQIVGGTRLADDTEMHAFVYDAKNGMVDLNLLIDPNAGWKLGIASDINAAGQIAATGYYGGKWRAVLLTPIPEPASHWLATIGLASVLCHLLKRRRGRRVAVVQGS